MKTNGIVRKVGRPRGSKNRSSAGHWFDAAAARSHLQRIDHELSRLKEERDLILHVLGRPIAAASAWAGKVWSQVPGARRGRKPRDGGPSLLDNLARIVAQGPAGKGWTVGELREELKKLDPRRATVSNASALISSSLAQALRAKKPRFVGSKASRGHARKYRLATND